MAVNRQLKFNNNLGEIPELEEMTQFKKVDNKSIITIHAKLEVLEMLSGIVDSLREGLTRQLVVNDIKDETVLENKLKELDVVEKTLDTPLMKEVLDYVDNQFKNE
jgi:hypothetical protein|tara:strand:- start:4908 stop:5225 length:318 start_codon:yes stop_codon:yes gene_type:complete